MLLRVRPVLIGLLPADSGDTRLLEFTITKGEHDELIRGVIRDFRHATRGIRVWGAHLVVGSVVEVR